VVDVETLEMVGKPWREFDEPAIGETPVGQEA
jgi:hypothetical protein